MLPQTTKQPDVIKEMGQFLGIFQVRFFSYFVIVNRHSPSFKMSSLIMISTDAEQF